MVNYNFNILHFAIRVKLSVLNRLRRMSFSLILWYLLTALKSANTRKDDVSKNYENFTFQATQECKIEVADNFELTYSPT